MQVARYSACSIAWHRREQPAVAVCGIVPIAAVVLAFQAGTYRLILVQGQLLRSILSCSRCCSTRWWSREGKPGSSVFISWLQQVFFFLPEGRERDALLLVHRPLRMGGQGRAHQHVANLTEGITFMCLAAAGIVRSGYGKVY